MSDTKDALIVKAQVPGVSKDDLHVDISASIVASATWPLFP
ncbi:MAG TPA: Hsp20/alpha crystallin family protein [Candidatus Entotheonella sp.]|jgi:HSP20 family molecular chaperone IbpA